MNPRIESIKKARAETIAGKPERYTDEELAWARDVLQPKAAPEPERALEAAPEPAHEEERVTVVAPVTLAEESFAALDEPEDAQASPPEQETTPEEREALDRALDSAEGKHPGARTPKSSSSKKRGK